MIAIVPLRSGSKSIKNKNIKTLAGHPLCYYALKALCDNIAITQVIVATDSEEYKKVIRKFGFDKIEFYKRSKESCTDTASTEFLLLEVINKYNFNNNTNVLLCQVTDPFLLSSDIDNAIFKMRYEKSSSVVSCTICKKFFWTEDGKHINYLPSKRPRRQDPHNWFYYENGSFYISSVGAIKKSKCRISGKISIYEMDPLYSYDLDEPEDWAIVENLMKRFINNNKKKKVKNEY
jgi:N-acylneuraminate cytidylyltransferase